MDCPFMNADMSAYLRPAKALSVSLAPCLHFAQGPFHAAAITSHCRDPKSIVLRLYTPTRKRHALTFIYLGITKTAFRAAFAFNDEPTMRTP